jgi:two-component system, OmpR family, flagellar system response regulator FtcR
MIVLIDERNLVVDSYRAQLKREGFSSVGFSGTEYQEWFDTSIDDDFESVGACLVGAVDGTPFSPAFLKRKTGAPIIALVDQNSLENTLRLFETGFDDVLRKPVHIREILARISAIKRRSASTQKVNTFDRLKIFFDGRDPEIDDEIFPLPRRERRILEYLAATNGRRVTKTQIFNSIYGVYDEDVDENVVESHISKLRKKLREKLGFDLVDSKRFLGYRLVGEPVSAGKFS